MPIAFTEPVELEPMPRAGDHSTDAGAGRKELERFFGSLEQSLDGLADEVPDIHGSFPSAAVDRLRAAGILSATLPEAAGGLGLGEPRRSDLLKRLLVRIGRCDQILGRLYEGHVNAHLLAFRFGDEETRGRVAADTRDGHLFGVWNTEPSPGGVEIDSGSGVLRGRKIHASGAGFVTRPLVTASTKGRGQMLITPLEEGERADLSGWRARGMRASATGQVSFDGYPLDRAIRVGKPDDYVEQPFFSAGAWRFLAVHLGGIEAVHLAHKAHLVRLSRHEDPHQLVRLGQSAIAVETARAFVGHACSLANGTGSADARSTIAYVNLARAAVERAGLDAIELAQRSVGLAAMIENHPLERVTRDLATYLRQPGPDHALTEAARRLFEIEGCYLPPERR